MSDFDDALEILGVTEAEIFESEADRIDDAVDKKADQVMNKWRSRSPEDSGDYKDKFQTRPLHDPEGRPVTRITNMSRHAHIVEYGSDKQHAHGVRAKIAEDFGNEGRYIVEGAE